MQKKLRLSIFTMMLMIVTGLQAEQPANLEPLPDAPRPPDVVDSGETLEPEITIINKEEEVIEEYRLNGHLYMIKITPAFGPSYYILDQDGDGKMETNMSVIYSNFVVPSWVIYSW
ncbi:MAG: DUF2782 domain-containing protein [Gammaproteobacteria bacterium]